MPDISHAESYDRLEAACARGVGLRVGRDDDLVQVARGDLRVLLAAGTDPKMLAALRDIAQATDPDDEDSYRADDREGCLDTVHSLAANAVAGVTASAP